LNQRNHFDGLRPQVSIIHDGNGKTLTDVAPGGDKYIQQWDFENRLTSVALPGSGGTISFKCDPDKS
jgi:YD repeat-containing protein